MPQIIYSQFIDTTKIRNTDDEFEFHIKKFSETKNHLEELSIDELVFIFDKLSKDWQERDSELYETFRDLNLGFLISWLKKRNIMQILNISFKDIRILDKAVNYERKVIKTFPKGLIVHWIAGNVPLLGILSLFQGILTKNKNIVKVPASFKNVLALILRDIENKVFEFGSKKIDGSIISGSTLVVYVDKDDIHTQSLLSENADIRFAWGGREAIESIMGLKKKIDCEDIIMGPKISLAVVSKEYLDSSTKVDELTDKITRDVFTFDQLGCNAPHNIFIEKGSKTSIDDFASALSKKFSYEAQKKPLSDRQPIETYNILSERVFYSMSNKRNSNFDESYNYNIFIDYYNQKVASPLYNNSIYLKQVDDILDVPMQFPSEIQTVGVCIEKKRQQIFLDKAIEYGALRVTEIGKMGIYDTPWDGILTMTRMVKWISLPR